MSKTPLYDGPAWGTDEWAGAEVRVGGKKMTITSNDSATGIWHVPWWKRLWRKVWVDRVVRADDD